MRRMTGEKGLVCCMARLESAPGTRDMLALHEALVALRGSNGLAARLSYDGKTPQTKNDRLGKASVSVVGACGRHDQRGWGGGRDHGGE